MFNTNSFANAAIQSASMTYTENGHPVASTTGSALLDLYGQIGALRGQDEGRICELFDKAVSEDKLLAAKILFYGRDARGGTGERQTFRTLAKYAADKYPELLINNLQLVPFYGRWDDLYSLVGTKLEDKMFHEMRQQIVMDIYGMGHDMPVSLLAKWLKSCNASSKETRKLGQLTWRKLNFADERTYRKILSKLRKHIDIVESKMSANQWGDIEYGKVPSRANLNYRAAFRKHDGERYSEYLKSVERGEQKINASMNTPQDLVHAYVPEIGRAHV